MDYFIEYSSFEKGLLIDGIAMVPEEMEPKLAEKLISNGKGQRLSDEESKKLYKDYQKVGEEDWDADEP